MPVRAYFDTSVLLKRYIHEEGSERARSLLRLHRVVSSVLAPVEARSALLRRRMAGQLSENDFSAILGRIRTDVSRWELVEVNQYVLERAEGVIDAAYVNTLDAIHIATALLFQERSGIRIGFISADARQLEGARRMALKVTALGVS